MLKKLGNDVVISKARFYEVCWTLPFVISFVTIPSQVLGFVCLFFSSLELCFQLSHKTWLIFFFLWDSYTIVFSTVCRTNLDHFFLLAIRRWWIHSRKNKRWTWSRTWGVVECSRVGSCCRRERNSLVWDRPRTGKFSPMGVWNGVSMSFVVVGDLYLTGIVHTLLHFMCRLRL